MEIKIRVKGTQMLDIRDFRDFQGSLKTISDEAMDKLKQSILRNGFNAPVFVWKGHNYILDGHQRIKAVLELMKEDYTIPENKLPFIEIEADSKQQAAEMVLAYNSQYGTITEDGLMEFIDSFDLDIEDLDLSISLPDIDLKSLNGLFDNNPKEKEITKDDLKTDRKCPKCGYEW